MFAPTFAHVNEEGVTVNEAIAQLSVEPPLTFAAVIVAFPVGSKATVNGAQVATGAIRS